MTITSKNCLVSHVLTFDKGELIGGYIEDCDLFLDCYGFVLGSSETRRSAIQPKHLASIAVLLELAYGDYPQQLIEIDDEPEDVEEPVEATPEDWGTASGIDIAKDVITEAPIVVEAPVLPLTALELPVVYPEPIVLLPAPEATPVVAAPVEASTDVATTPEPTFVVPAQSVPADAKPEPTPEATAPANESPDPETPAIATSSDPVVDSSQEPVSGLPVIDAGIVSPVVAAEPAAEPKSTDNLNDTDNELSLKAFL